MIEHLATFTVSKSTGIVYPADGMRRLLHLEKSNGIWSQKMQLRLDQSWVLIMDFETGVSEITLMSNYFYIFFLNNSYYIFGLGCNGTISNFISERTNCFYEQ